jgi:hypothetical protein
MKKAAPFLFVILLFAVGAFYFFAQEPDPVHQLPQEALPPVMPAETQQSETLPEVGVAYPTPEPEPEAGIIVEPLPVLIESDTALTRQLAGVTGTDVLSEYLVKDQVISRFVVTIDSLTSRKVPSQFNPLKPVGDKFIVETLGDKVVLSPKNFARYDGYVASLNKVNPEMLMATYRRYYPLFQQAWEENGQQGSFDDRLNDVIDSLLDTPDVPGPVYLVKPEAFYLFEEPELEAMTAGQKILIRMGSVNASIVKEKLAELKAAM